MKRPFSLLNRPLAWALDSVLCTAMNHLQWNLRHQASSLAELEAYLAECQILTREAYYAVSPLEGLKFAGNRIFWDTPINDDYPENNRTCVEWYRLQPNCPTIILLHALMSTGGSGYRRLANWFNQRGWNAVFPHLPCHYSRTPAGHWNGSLTLTSNLIRNATLLRQGVIEIRQLLALLREQGCKKFAILGTSYGGWIASLVSFLESDLEFIALLQPIVNVQHAIGESPAARSIRWILNQKGISPDIVHKHAHLSSPLHGIPLSGGKRILLATGVYDCLAPSSEHQKLAEKWGAPNPLKTSQGHFGYATLRIVKDRIVSLL